MPAARSGILKIAQCATAELPLNYHHPNGAKTTVALLKIKAKDPVHRLGTLFVNPGGPGDSARDLALAIAGDTPQADPLISSDNWGHTSLGTGACVDNDTFAYLTSPTAPAPKIILCTGDVQPFASSAPALTGSGGP